MRVPCPQVGGSGLACRDRSGHPGGHLYTPDAVWAAHAAWFAQHWTERDQETP